MKMKYFLPFILLVIGSAFAQFPPGPYVTAIHVVDSTLLAGDQNPQFNNMSTNDIQLNTVTMNGSAESPRFTLSTDGIVHMVDGFTADDFTDGTPCFISGVLTEQDGCPTPGGLVPDTRTISTTSPLSGGGALSSDLTLTLGTVPTSKGGTNATSWASGDLPYLSSTSQFSALQNSSGTKKFLSVTSSSPSLAALSATDLAVADGWHEWSAGTYSQDTLVTSSGNGYCSSNISSNTSTPPTNWTCAPNIPSLWGKVIHNFRL